jgi:3-oxoacyl-[acyl-carrier protein] reductase
LVIDLTGREALVTGGSRGVGSCVAHYLARAGARVGIGYRSRAAEARDTIQLMAKNGGRGWSHASDLSFEDGVEALFRRVDEECPDGLDLFVGNAGVWPPEDVAVERMSTNRWVRTMAVNSVGLFLTTREALRRMNDGGRVVLIGSCAGLRGEPFHADYSASKGAVAAFTKAVCIEVADRGITVNCVAPGWIDTEMVSSVLGGPEREQIESRIPLGRVASGADVAGVVVFLCSEFARHVTGDVIRVDGGATLAF